MHWRVDVATVERGDVENRNCGSWRTREAADTSLSM